jgi:metal-responsive CopG/Arc/MetJ family transcriptional regulator
MTTAGGKPPYPGRVKVIPVQIMLPPDDVAELDAMANAESESRSTLVRRAIKMFLKQNLAALTDGDPDDNA